MFKIRIYNKQRILEDKIKSTPFSVLVFGSGPKLEKYHKKRQDIIKRLKEEGFDAYTCEELSKDIPSSVPATEQEVLQTESADWLIFLDTSEGPLSELSNFCVIPSILKKAFVLYPAKYGKEETFSKAVLRNYPYTHAYKESQFTRCDLVPICLDTAKALRRAKYLEVVPFIHTLEF